MQCSSPDDITDPMHILFSFHPKEEEVEKAHSRPTTSPHQGATAPVSRGEPASSPPEAMAIAPATSSEDFVSEVYAFGDVEVVAVRPRAWPEETSTADCDETGRVAWRAQPTLCAYLSSKRGRREVIASRRRVRELGCGLGIPGILCWRLGAKEVELTDGNAGVVKDLKLAIAENEARAGSARVGLGKITARELAWGSDGTMDWSEEGKWEMIVASDVVYSATSASGVLECVERTLSLTDGLFVLAYVSRWPNVDRALYDAVVSTGFDATLIPLATFTQEESLEELSDRPCLFALRRSVDRAMGCFTAEDPNVCGVSREWFVEETGRLVVTPIDALTETFGTDLDVLLQSHASNIKMLEINAKGPFKLDRNVIQVLFSTLEKHATLLNLVEIEIVETWMNDDCWRVVEAFLTNVGRSLQRFVVEGEDLSASSLRTFGSSLEGLTELRVRRCERFDAAAAQTLCRNWNTFALKRLDISNCPLGDEGVRLVCSSLSSSLEFLRLCHVDLSALGIPAMCKALDERLDALRELDISSNENVSSSGAAELGDSLRNVSNSLITLDLRGCAIGDEGLRWLSQSDAGLPSLSNLESLKLGSNGIGDDSMEVFAESVLKTSLSRLKNIDLSMNTLTWRGMYDLTDAWDSEDEPVALTSINLRGNYIGDDGVEAISEVMHKGLRVLETLDLTGCDISASGVRHLIDTMRSIPSSSRRLTEVTLTSNPIEDLIEIARQARVHNLDCVLKLPEIGRTESVGVGH